MCNANLKSVSMFHRERNPHAPSDKNSALIWLNKPACHSLQNTNPSLSMCLGTGSYFTPVREAHQKPLQETHTTSCCSTDRNKFSFKNLVWQ